MITIESLLKFADGIRVFGLKEVVIEVTQKECDEIQMAIRDFFSNGGVIFNIIDYIEPPAFPKAVKGSEFDESDRVFTELELYFKQFRSICIGGITIHYKIKKA